MRSFYNNNNNFCTNDQLEHVIVSDGTRNACHGSDSPESASLELEFFFPKGGANRPSGRANTARVNDSTCCIIKPHAFKDRLAADIIGDIERAGFNISAIKSVTYDHYGGLLVKFNNAVLF